MQVWMDEDVEVERENRRRKEGMKINRAGKERERKWWRQICGYWLRREEGGVGGEEERRIMGGRAQIHKTGSSYLVNKV